jgi:hypothetical protein
MTLVIVVVESTVSPGSFDGITTNQLVLFPSSSVLGSSGWKTTGRVHIAAAGYFGMPKSSNSVPQTHSCVFQTHFGEAPTAAKSSIQRTYTGLDIGCRYVMSFWQTKRSDYPNTPMYYGVYIDGKEVFSTVPSTFNWVHVVLDSFVANATSVDIKFEISSDDQLDRDIGINGVTLEKATGIYIISGTFHTCIHM